MNIADLNNIYKAVVSIDYQSGELLHVSGVEPFTYIHDITSTDALNKTLLTFCERECTPVFKHIKVEGKWYWLSRKKVFDILYFFIEELPYIDLVLAEANQKAILDGLTKCYNKVEIETQAEQFLLRFLRYKNPFSIIMFDIDFFKKINDTYGHLTGDYILVELAQLVRSLLRGSDICGRFGGEEFLVILPETKVSAAMKLAKRINNACKEHHFIHGEKNIEVRISAGVTAPTQSDSVASLIERCDDALYDAKKNGRDRVEYR